MAARQVFLVESDLRAVVVADGVLVSVHGRRALVELPALTLAIGPGERILALCADSWLWQVGPPRAQRLWDRVESLSADAGLLAAVQSGSLLRLESARAGTTVDLPSPPIGISVLGAASGLSHFVLVLLTDSVWLVRWREEEEIAVSRILETTAATGVLLEGTPPLLAVREPPCGDAERVLVWQIEGKDEQSLRLRVLPPLLVDQDAPIAFRNSAGGPSVAFSSGRWALWRDGAWHFQAGPTVAPDFLPTRIYGSNGALEPYPPLLDKDNLPPGNKLAVSPLGRRPRPRSAGE